MLSCIVAGRDQLKQGLQDVLEQLCIHRLTAVYFNARISNERKNGYAGYCNQKPRLEAEFLFRLWCLRDRCLFHRAILFLNLLIITHLGLLFLFIGYFEDGIYKNLPTQVVVS